MIEQIKLKFGRANNVNDEVISITPVTVFVGPNNSGKSKVLQEIDNYCRTGAIEENSRIVQSISLFKLANECVDEFIDKHSTPNNKDKTEDIESIITIHGVNGQSIGLALSRLRERLLCQDDNINEFCHWYLNNVTLFLDGVNRINLVNQQPAGDLQKKPATSFQVLFRDADKRSELQKITFDAFGRYFVLDPTNLGTLRVRLSEHAPKSILEECGIHPDAVQFHAAAQHIDKASDGVKAFTGIVTALIAGDPRIILIDEPEAFLHPSLASKLGKEVAKAALATNKRVFASTHSPQFVMGCIQSGAPTNIVRLTYVSGIATARILPSNELLELMRHPLLRSTGLLSGLFYDFVIVTESDADRAFYQEINERLLQFKPDWGIPNCLFINAQNKHTIHTLLKPLRKLGIPAAGIIDIDILKEGGTNWKNFLASANVPNFSQEALASLRQAIKKAMDNTGKDMKRDGGVKILEQDERSSAENLLAQLSEYGLFVIPNGELESWMKHLECSGHGPSWLIEIFGKMGVDTTDPSYEKPTDDDVWHFIYTIRKWLLDASRKGIPS